MDTLSFESIGEEEAIWLERPFKDDEVFEVIKAMNSDKAMGIDGFTMVFFQTCLVLLWHFSKLVWRFLK